jgi:hypothetical protein
MLNPQPHISNHEPWIWRQFAQQLPLGAARTGNGTRAASRPDQHRLPTWSPGELVATNEAYEAALRTIGAADPRVVAMEADPDSSTYAQTFPAAPAVRPVESVIAEHVSAAPKQQMVATAIALTDQRSNPVRRHLCGLLDHRPRPDPDGRNQRGRRVRDRAALLDPAHSDG